MRRPKLPSSHQLRQSLRNPHALLHRVPLFRIFYSTTFLLASLLLAALLLITPGDHMYQAFQRRQIYYVIIVGGVYILTFVIAVVVYAGRLFATRSALAGIPRDLKFGQSVGIVGDEGTGEGGNGKSSIMRLGVKVNAKVAWVVRRGLGRSAVVAFQGRPRDLAHDDTSHRAIPIMKRKRRRKLGTLKETGGTLTPTTKDEEPVWGHVAHPGWSSPSSIDLPNLHYEPVLLELSNLVEAKAVSLAPRMSPVDVGVEEEVVDDDEPMPDPLIVNLLQRPASMGLRDYIAHLTTLGMIHPPEIGNNFLTPYERARFSGEAFQEIEFRTLMGMFAEILRGMRPVSQEIVDGLHDTAEAEMDEEQELHDDWTKGEGLEEADDPEAQSIASAGTIQRTPLPAAYETPSSSGASMSSLSSSDQGTVRTSSILRRPRTTRYVSAQSNSSVVRSSLKKMRSNTSTSTRSLARSDAGSVIRLADAKGPLDLPYTFVGDGAGPV